MKIALVSDWYHPRVGGLELHLRDLAHRLREVGHDVHVITPTVGESVDDGVPVHRTSGRHAPRFGFILTPAGVHSIAAVLDGEHFDVAHCHVSIVSPAAIGGARSAQRLGIPTAVTFHSIVPRTRLLAAALDFVIHSSRWPAAYSAVSERVARDVKPLAGRNPIRILPNGVDHAFWRAKPAAVPPRAQDTLDIVSVMRLNAKKRPLALIDMMRRLVHRLPPGMHARLRIAGEGPLRTRVEREIARHHLTAEVELLGHLSREELRELFARSDLFVLPAVRESFGLAALEARSAGLPVVAMAASGVAELIDHGREGLLARSDAELLSHVMRLSQDGMLRRRITAYNRGTMPRCDWETVLPDHLEFYSEAIALRASSMRST